MGSIIEINGPIVTVRLPGVLNGEQVRIGKLGLVGEVIGRDADSAVVQVYESTESLRPGEDAESLGHPLSVELGPGLLGNIFDGVQRPLHAIIQQSGDHIARGLNLAPLDRERRWVYTPAAELAVGKSVQGGTLLGSVQETETIQHRILVPPEVQGTVEELAPAGEYNIEHVIARLRDVDGKMHELRLYHRWPVRVPRPYRGRALEAAPLITGQRILDTFFPLLKGGKAAVPGPFGAGKTVVQQQIARWSNAQIVIYVGCGERGNELVEILETFPKLADPYTGRLLMERTLLVANTSNMPVVAREASIYVGVTLAEYYRDQGYDVVMVADSTSRWAEALREVAGRLGQMPVEEGYPAYLASRLAAFYERAGRVETLAGEFGSVTLIGAVSPPGGDFSEPVTSHTKEIVQTFWALSKELADARHYPSVDWNDSFSGYVNSTGKWWHENVDPRWAARRGEALGLLAQADELARIVNLVGPEALSPAQRWALEGAALIKEGVLQQSALDPIDSFSSPQKQFVLLDLMLDLYHQGADLLAIGVPVQQLVVLPILSRARRVKAVYSSEDVDKLRGFSGEIHEAFAALRTEYGKPGGKAA
ncbi:MAG: V-type ATP synthase subunit A [Candidatus Muproteobacteria bacterium RBG_19FT_COMBO_61_10]|uniref:V-type ATP synthase alpha chain n=1 Tax=Candidatus Muproteobacteria bacterium RBG_19FT_COMBO_61_10 TaxID=1817761 RepID=A0A1F6UJE7_9PROT|nr:MAG: V-type ATP synthase subunit A [Candidatus Muproteobacteria bacterium RBG_19FT_COMBO_61_10]